MAKKLDRERAVELRISNKLDNKNKRTRLVLFANRHVHSKSWGANTYHTYNQIFAAGEYTTDESLIDELIKSKADVEIYERVG